MTIGQVIESLSSLLPGVKRLDLVLKYNDKNYSVKCYWVGKIIRVDIEEKK